MHLETLMHIESDSVDKGAVRKGPKMQTQFLVWAKDLRCMYAPGGPHAQ